MVINWHTVEKSVLDAYYRTRKNIYSQENDCWTHLAAICVLIDGKVDVICFATGTKCLGASEVSDQGYSVNDSHAEVLCRRIFVKFLLDEISTLFSGNGYVSPYLELAEARGSPGHGIDENLKYKQRPDVKFLMFLTHTPCGDASIFPKADLHSGASTSEQCEDGERPLKRVKNDIHRTGAKCVLGQNLDLHLPGANFHYVGAFRTKPGRGEPTLSMSCSDKLAKWTVVGLQGSLAAYFLVCPILLNYVIVASEFYSIEAMKRALIDRNQSDGIRPLPKQLTFIHLPTKFLDGRETKSAASSPDPVCVIWHKNMVEAERLVRGYKQGANRTKLLAKIILSSDEKALQALCSSVCRRKLCEQYVALRLKHYGIIGVSDMESNRLRCLDYQNLKLSAKWYAEMWQNLKTIYSHWINDERKIRWQMFHI